MRRSLGSQSVVVSRLVAIAIATASVAPSPASAYTFRRAPTREAVRWRSRRLDVCVSSEITGEQHTSRDLARAAAEAWEGVEGAPAFDVGGACRGTAGYRGADDENGIYRPEAGWSYGDRLAVTVTTARAGDGTILDADVVVSPRTDLELLDGEHATGSRSFDLRSVLTHELGHVLGLGESDVAAATMFATLRRGDVDRRTIDRDDAEGAAAIYEGAITSEPSATALTGCAVTTGHAGRMPVVWIALATLLALRKRRSLRAVLVAGGLIFVVGFDLPSGAAGAHAVTSPLVAGWRDGTVTSIELADHGGLWTTTLHVDIDGETREIDVPGGVRDGLVQIVGEEAPPEVGERLALDLHGAWAFTDGDRMWGGSLAAE